MGHVVCGARLRGEPGTTASAGKRRRPVDSGTVRVLERERRLLTGLWCYVSPARPADTLLKALVPGRTVFRLAINLYRSGTTKSVRSLQRQGVVSG